MGAYLAAGVGTLFRYRCPEIALSNGSYRFAGAMTILASTTASPPAAASGSVRERFRTTASSTRRWSR